MRLQSIRLLTEYRLVVSAELPRGHLERNLAMLAEAGLHGMVTETLRFELDGEAVPDVQMSEHSDDPTLLRPPTDPRIETAARELRLLSQRLDAALGWRSDGGGEPPITLDDEAVDG